MSQSIPPSRRALLTAAAALGALPSMAHAAKTAKGKALSPNRLWYAKSAGRWDEALPIGNGRLGAMVFGRVGQERLQLNEDTLWAGSPYTPDNPDALAALPEVRNLINQGRYEEATKLASDKVMAKPLRQMNYGTLGDILLTFKDPQTPKTYERALDLDSALAATRFTTTTGAFRREAFASAPDQVIVVRLDADKGELNFALSYRGPHKAEYPAPDYSGSTTDLIPTESVDWLKTETPIPLRADQAITADGANALLITGHNEENNGIPAGLTYALRIRAVTDGRVAIEGGELKIAHARHVTLILAAATSYVNYHDVSGDPVAIVRRQSDAAAVKPYAQLRQAHINEHSKLFGGVRLDLGRTSAARRTTDRRVAVSTDSDDPALAALYFQYARYLMVASSRPGTQPANLQGIWNEGTNPPWGSKYTININTEMNYWPADPSGLGVCVEPLLRMVEDLSVTGARTARTMYNARGWVAHHNTDLWRAAAPIDGPIWGLWPTGGAWLCNSLWAHYDYSRDAEVLKRLYPLLTGAAQFFLDTLVEDPKGRGLVTSPSLSPENKHPFGSSLCAGAAMDRQIVRDLLDHTIEAATLLNRDTDQVTQWRATRDRIAPDRINKSGKLQEWLEDWDDEAPEQHHRHVSHLYGVYPSSQINVRDTPALIEAAKTSLNARGDLATGWGTAWRLCLRARMQEGDHAHTILKALLGPQRTYPNLFDAHPPFQIDGNFGGAAGIMEMLLQSWGGDVHILPALPTAWPSGEVSGLKARGNLTVDMRWTAGKLTRLKITGAPGASVRVRYKGKLTSIKLDAKGAYLRTG